MTDYDVIVLGAGGAGYTAAFETSRAGMKVLMLDPKFVLGGNCLYEGCIPSKTYWLGASLARREEKLPFVQTKVSFEKLVDWKDSVQEQRFVQHSQEVKEHENVTFMGEAGTLLDQNHVKVKDRVFSTKYVVVATGAEPLVPDGFQDGITTHDLLMPKTKVRSLPESLAIVGGGYIGLEMSSIFSKLGSKVTLYASHLLNVSVEVQDLLEKRLKENGVEIVKERAKQVKKADGVKYVITEKGERKYEEVLVATGRRPNVKGINLPLGKRGEIEVTHGMRSKVDNIFAPGDINGKFMLFHVAVLEGWVASQNIIEGGREVVEMDYHAVPFAVYSDPQVAWSGMWKEDAVKAGYEVEVRRFDLSKDARAQIEGDAEGWIDVVVEKGSQRILGAQVVGKDADLLIGELSLAIGLRMTTYEMGRFSQPHPTQLENITSLMRKAMSR
ncbi:dihydrolipoyl dehydrogenase [Sulfuracidifex tepidarius]|uniref:Dihydrolipoyl dehydrogenase n=1 Tax=Sulfuracidifex tepidarius TaxID=1294262 RepID=A0A510DXR2_9CREN|nr:dihydrolipoyl dehydrogenase [Sulfuracidifex tepidarius]BBG24770.1 Dihydrolipoyl dehydrogenase [Sulfuracidifex tepidarius]BBG27559.1 Dihydrolipoyl dehydrogenase [Sulfuracidifex tepidarius]